MLPLLRTAFVCLCLVALPAVVSAECFQLSKDSKSFSPSGDRLCLSEGYGGWNLSLYTGLPTAGGGGVGYSKEQIMRTLISRISHPTCKDCNKDEYALLVGSDESPVALLTLYFDGKKNASRQESGTLRLGGETFHYRTLTLPARPASQSEKCSQLTKDGKGWRVVADEVCALIPTPKQKELTCHQLAFEMPNWSDSVCLTAPADGRVFVRFTLGQQRRPFQFIARPIKSKMPLTSRFELVRSISQSFDLELTAAAKSKGAQSTLTIGGTQALSRPQ